MIVLDGRDAPRVEGAPIVVDLTATGIEKKTVVR
jgi:hypothetical protein